MAIVIPRVLRGTALEGTLHCQWELREGQSSLEK